jgi:hypothetical protein
MLARIRGKRHPLWNPAPIATRYRQAMTATGPQARDRQRRTRQLLAAAGLVLAACSTEPMTPDPCTGPPVALTPEAAVLAVGDTVLAKAALVGPPECRPINMTLRTLRWRANDSSIARVSALKGYVVAKSPGNAVITVYYPADSSTWGDIHITVVGP